MRARLLYMSVAALTAVSAFATTAEAVEYTIYFGEDPGIGETTPLASFPDATTAANNFLATIVDAGVEDFESYAPGMVSPLAIDFGTAGTATLVGSGQIAEVAPGTTNGFGRYPTSGTNFWEGTNPFSIQFSEAVAAFGFFGIDMGDFDGQVTLELANGESTLITVPNATNTDGGGVLFFGLTTQDEDSLFTSVTFGNTSPGADFFGFDDFTIAGLGQVIPVPAAAWLGMAGLGLIGARRATRRNKRKRA